MATFTPQTIQYLHETIIPVRLSCITETGWPVVLSLWYTYHDGAIYCATQQHAKVVGYLQHQDRCAYEIAADTPPYCGIRGQATAVIQPDLGALILDKLLLRYLGSYDTPLARKLRQRTATEVAIRIDPINTFTWNFSSRMQSAASDTPTKACPD